MNIVIVSIYLSIHLYIYIYISLRVFVCLLVRGKRQKPQHGLMPNTQEV